MTREDVVRFRLYNLTFSFASQLTLDKTQGPATGLGCEIMTKNWHAKL